MASSKANATSPCSQPTRGCTYDVFLSFRGEDTRYTFVDHLYAALVQKGLQVFKDDEMIYKGKPISLELTHAIEESRFAVVVLSKSYANSSWCLEELVKIIKCRDQMGLMVLPVFYHVDPSDVRKQKGYYADAFQKHEENKINDNVNNWRDALAAAANLSGYHISAVTGGEFSVIKKIVQEIMGNIQPRGREDNLIGIESHIEALNPLLSMQTTEEVHIIGIYGMGGIGKTTIAQALFRRISFKYEGSSFVKNVREQSSSKKDICALQEKVLTDVLGTNLKFIIQDPEYGADVIQERLCSKKVLIVLDDIDDVRQLEFLAESDNWFGAGSRIIITTRNEHILSYANAKYKPALLRMDQAVELFSRHAFRKNSPPEGYKELSNRAICYTGCLPLALKILGSFFRGREARVWESALDRLAKLPNREVFDTLKLSFDDLNEFEKKIILDIACFFKGREVKDVTRILDAFGFHPVIGISVLIEKSLITISKERIGMHDLIQEMCLQIVRESFTNSRLRNLEEVHELVVKKGAQELIEAIVVPKEYNQDQIKGFRSNVFKQMNNLRLLDVNDEFITDEPSFLPNNLRWITWNHYPFSSLPIPHKSKLVGLEMKYGKVPHLWKGTKKWAAVDRCSSIVIPRSKIPSWFKQQRHGHKISLKLQPIWQTKILGFAVCFVIKEFTRLIPLNIVFQFENYEMIIPKLEADDHEIDASSTTENGNVWISYIPFTSFKQMHDDCYDFQREDWSHVIEGDLVIYFSTVGLQKALRCGAHVVYKEDVESIQQSKPSLSSSYWNWKLYQWSANTIRCRY